MDGVVAYILGKSYTKKSLIGIGALAGAPCQVQSIDKVGKTTTITLKWEDNIGGIHTQAFDIEDGLDGVSVTNATINANGNLILTLSDGNDIDCGKVLPQYDTMPPASSTNVGQVLQYIGTTSGGYTKGYYYECINDSGVYKWINIKVQDSEDVFRYAIVPSPTSSIEGKIIQYIGVTNSTYTNGYYYQCVESPVGSGTYIWVQKNVQPNNGGGGGDGVVDGYYNSTNQLFYEDSAFLNPITGEDNTIYVDLNTNGLYRYNGVIFIKVSSSAESIQVSTMPTADVSQLNKIYQYIGATDANYTNGYFYKCQLDAETGNYKWINIEVQSAVKSVNNKTGVVVLDAKDIGLQVTTMPSADADHLGDIVQYIGNTTQDYTNGRFYKCVYDGVSVYSWIVAEDYISKSNTVGLVKNDGTIDETTYIPTSQKGANEGVAELDTHGKVPSSQLPSYVDDVIDGYYYDDTHFYKEAGMSGYYNITDNQFYKDSEFTELITPVLDNYYLDIPTGDTYKWNGSAYVSDTPTRIVGESGVIYISVDSNIQYRWTGTAFAALGGALQLGETSTTAYRGDRGKTAYDHSQITNGSNPHNTTANHINLNTPITTLSGTQLTVESALNGVNNDTVKTFTGTQAQWDALTTAEKQKYEICNITDDGSTDNVYTVGEVDALLNEKLSYADNDILGAKNLLKNNAISQTINGVTFTVNADGSVKVNGTATGDTTIRLVDTRNQNKSLYKGQRVILSKGLNAMVANTNIWFNCYDGNTFLRTLGSAQGILTSESDPFTVDYSDYDGISIGITISNGITVSNIIFYPMLRLATDTGSTYQPYAETNYTLTQNKMSYVDNGILGAKNLWIPNSATGSGSGLTWTSDEDGIITVTGQNTGQVSYYIGILSHLILPKGTYIFSGCPTNSLNMSLFVRPNSTTQAIWGQDDGDSPKVMTLTEDTDVMGYIRVGEGVNVGTQVFKPMITLVSDAQSNYANFRPYAMTNRKLTEAYSVGVITANSNLNDYYKTGDYYSNTGSNTSTLVNKPSDLTAAFRLSVICADYPIGEGSNANNVPITQKIELVNGVDPVIYMRHKTGGGDTYGSWYKFTGTVVS